LTQATFHLSEPELKALMLRSQAGDAAAYRALLAGLRERLEIYFGRRLRGDPAQTEDLVQETLMAIHAKRATFDGAQLLTAWTYAIARYKLVDHFRRSGRARFRPIEDDDLFVVDDEIAAADARRDLTRALADLPKHTRDLVVSVKLHEEPVADVARRTGMSEGAVKVAVHRGFQKLAARLRGGGGGGQ
jgi:RNA polymerase sigma-70 factor (ECF subfamily)